MQYWIFSRLVFQSGLTLYGWLQRVMWLFKNQKPMNTWLICIAFHNFLFKIYIQTHINCQIRVKVKWKMGIQEVAFLSTVTTAFLTLGIYLSSRQELKFSWRNYVEPQVFWFVKSLGESQFVIYCRLHPSTLTLRWKPSSCGPPGLVQTVGKSPP